METILSILRWIVSEIEKIPNLPFLIFTIVILILLVQRSDIQTPEDKDKQ